MTGFLVRKYAPRDREAVRHVCCETGFMGKPVDPLFSDREAFADFFTRYYTDYEPEHAWVLEHEGRVIGYLTACLHYRRYAWVQSWLTARIVFRVLARAALLRYSHRDYRFMSWFVFRSAFEIPRVPPRMGHFHINLLPEGRSVTAGGMLLASFIRFLDDSGVRRIYGQMQIYGTRRRRADLFEKLGFRLYDEKPVSKFHDMGREDVHLATFVRDITLPATKVSRYLVS